jgi:hypothetical protein
VYANHILIIHYMTPHHYIWFVLYDLFLMTIGWKMSRQTLNDYLSFATRSLQLRAFSHIVSSMTTKLVIYGTIDLRISFNGCKTFPKCGFRALATIIIPFMFSIWVLLNNYFIFQNSFVQLIFFWILAIYISRFFSRFPWFKPLT